MRVLFSEVMAILAHAVALLRHVMDFAVIAVAVEEIFAPGNAVADLQRVAAHVFLNPGADLFDYADDLVSENARAWIWPPALVRMDVRAADGRHGDLHQHLT